MNRTEANEASDSPAVATLGSIRLHGSQVQALRERIHELANILTGVMIASDLLHQHSKALSLQHYASHICDGSARGCALVQDIRSQLLAACGEVEVQPTAIPGESNSFDSARK